MSFVDRPYPDIVRDVLTNLTQGVSRETHPVRYDPLARPVQVPDIVLRRRPVRRVSVVEGHIEPAPGAALVPYTFTLNDYELLPNQDPDDVSLIHFLPFGRKPANGTDVVVNYFPRNTDPTPITDLTVGSVARTLLEAVSRELALLYAQLNLAYDSAFLETATGASLDRVVALLAYQRFRAGRPIGTVTFTRRAGSAGDITIPAGTPITDTADKIRYDTIETRAMLALETTAQVAVRGATDATPPVDAGVLTVIQRSIAGLETVTNERGTTRASGDETDEQLRGRARDALIASNKGTVSAIEHGLLQLPEVRSVKVVEMPNGVPGEISIAVSLKQPAADSELPAAVKNRIEALRPAGIRVLRSAAASVALQASVQLTLAGRRLAPAEVTQVHARARAALVAEVDRKAVGEKIRNRPLVAAVLRDPRVVDAVITLGVTGGAVAGAGEDIQPDPGAAVVLSAADVAFAADVFDQPLGPGDTIPVEVRAIIGATLLPGALLEPVTSQLQARLRAFFETLAPGTAVDTAALLTALRDDGKYAIDPLKLSVTLTSADQFAQIVQGGAAFQVLPGQVFTVASVDLTPAA
ncbi:MAG TPA: hypothetical protein VGD07_17200 [Methylomirabilota bacterium]